MDLHKLRKSKAFGCALLSPTQNHIFCDTFSVIIVQM